MRRLAMLAALTSAILALVPAIAGAAPRPIVYVVVIDGLDGDKVEAGKAPFISSLLAGEGARATYFPRSRSVMPAETNPNHTAMMSGAYPGASGIPANAFALYAPLENEDSCRATGPFDFRAIPTETSGENANCPRAQFVFEAIRRQGNPRGLATAAIFGKPKLGRIFAGRNFRRGRRDVDYLWAPCSSGPDDDSYCETVPTNPISGYAIDDDTVMDRVIASIEEGIEFRGRRKRPDFTFVNLHQVDSAGHATGTGPFYDQTIGMADMEVQELVAKLRERGEWGRTVLILASDHSMETTPQRVSITGQLEDAGIPESRFLAVDNGSADFIYLADRRSAGRFALLKRMRAVALATSGVAEALYRQPNPLDGGAAHTVARVHPGWTAGRRSGDLYLVAENGATFSEPSQSANPLPGNHGGPQTRDNFLAVVSGGTMVRRRTVGGKGRAARPTNADLAATVMGLFGMFAPEDNRGRFLAAAFDRGRLGPPVRPRIRVVRRGITATASSGSAAPATRAFAKLAWRPKGGRYDVRAGKRRLRATKRTSIYVRARPGSRRCARVRAISAAGRKSRFAKRCVRL